MSPNVNSSLYQHRNYTSTPLSFAIPFTLASGTLCIFGAASNFFLMALLAKVMKTHHNLDLYISSLCLSDFLYNAVLQPYVIHRLYATSRARPLNHAFSHGSITTLFLTATSSLFFASLDKYLFIKFPLRYGLYINKKNTRFLVVLIWLTSIAFGIFWSFDKKNVKKIGQATVGAIFVSTIIVQILTFNAARKQKNKIKRIYRSLGFNHPECLPQKCGEIITTRATRTIVLILVVYICSWLPTNLYRLHYLVFGGNFKVYHKWVKLTNMLIQIHACINPYVYLFRSREAKKAVQVLFKKWGWKIPSCLAITGTETQKDQVSTRDKNRNELEDVSRIEIALSKSKIQHHSDTNSIKPPSSS